MSLSRRSSSAALVLGFGFYLLGAVPTWPQAVPRRLLTAQHRYVLGDNDSRNDARTYCFQEVKKKLVEDAGVFVESSVEVRNAMVAKSEVRSLAAAILSVQRTRDDLVSEDGRLVALCEGQTTVDVAEIESQLRAISGNAAAKRWVLEQQEKVRELERELQALRAAMAAASERGALARRGRKAEVVSDITTAGSGRVRFLEDIQRVTQAAAETVKVGMTTGEVSTIVGGPRARDRCLEREYWNYGQVWVIFYSTTVRCLVEADSYGGRCSVCPSTSR